MSANLSLPRSKPELQGISSASITSFLKAVQDRSLELHSFMLVRHGHVVSEGWWAPYLPDRPHMLFSLSKSFTSTAIGLLVGEGRISLDDRVISFFPKDVPAEVSPNLSAMTIRHLLMMGTGHAEDTTGKMQVTDNWISNFLKLPVEHEPGTQFVYNSGATYMLSAILQKVTDQTLLDYLQPRLFEPLGIQGATSESCPRGIHIGGWGMKIKTEDIAKFGQLYLQKGQWAMKQLIPDSWVEEATFKQISNDSNTKIDWAQGYGYQFWKCRHGAYRGDGAFGQFCIVLPEQDAVIAITSGLEDMQAVLDTIWEHLLPAMKSEELPGDKEAADVLTQELHGLRLEPPRFHSNSTRETDISGIEFELEDNEEQLRTISIDFTEESANVTLQNNTGKHTVYFGRNEWYEGTYTLYMRKENVAFCSATWQDSNTLLLTLRYVETPFCLTTVCTFQDGNIQLQIRQNVSFGNEEPKTILGKVR
ncbi:CubicO group peptidase, beta-lactamase class C family [Paenibacillus sp. yr247]|uniref:serine hydrolase domain-containing protein n=1 Tax=Paenibacillus sp. yr247 TaxID=1761880 RepID=UPI000891D17A|nr:serine hydrolase [Paenibacillus sp. yr247]SDO12299.1 CubicO group peptidase, beta-lactamase class C family [Paenibacillus sp. yr247]